MFHYVFSATKPEYLRGLESRYQLRDPTKMQQYVSSERTTFNFPFYNGVLFILELKSELPWKLPLKGFQIDSVKYILIKEYGFPQISAALSAGFWIDIVPCLDLLSSSLHLTLSPHRKIWIWFTSSEK